MILFFLFVQISIWWFDLCYEHVWKIWIVILSYLREFIWKLTRFRIWRSQSTSDIRSSVHICSLDQIFSLCYLFLDMRLTLYLIFIVTSDVNFTLANDLRVERNKIVVNSWRFHLQHEISINSWRSHIFSTKSFYQSAMTMIHCL